MCSGKTKKEEMRWIEMRWIWCFRADLHRGSAAPDKQLSVGEGCEYGMSELCFRCSFLMIWFDVLIQKSCFPDSYDLRFNLL